MAGKVYLVGAGPGDPGLLTLKGKVALERADCVIYDILANDRLLSFTRSDCERIFVKTLGPRPTVRQNEVNRLMIARAREGRVVVRLKGGDPFIFGRGGEEAEELVRAGISFEVIPGITSGYAAPAYAGIPVTHRKFVSGVSFITGHEDPGEEGSGLDWANLAASRNTLVFFMSSKNLPEIARALVQHGRKPETPVAVIRWGTKAEQKVMEGTLADIVARSGNVQPPSIIIVGEVVKLRTQLNWFERLPLFGKRIAITRVREQAGAFREALEELGAQAIEIPTIEIRDPDSWEPLDQAIGRLETFQYLLVTSANGVRNFLRRLAACGRDVRDLKGLAIGAIGPATAAEFTRTGVKVDFIPREYRAEGLLEVLNGHDLKGKAFLIPRARVARDLVPRVLVERGARVEVVTAYQTLAPEFRAGELEELLTPPPDVITFTSSSTATHFSKILGDRPLRAALEGIAIASIGPITSATLQTLGISVTVEARESTMQGLVRAITEYFNQHAQ
ncbi:MAG TPA: uroporphyrinogen-III C-methyltransferase [Terriglobia bacterium]|nr:uroporphyrinogen-III C-methyltransferase [Terriglobia bacterium]